MNKILVFALLTISIASCVTDSMKKGINKSFRQSFQLMDDKDFKNGLSLIEIHKLRNGSYPDQLSDLEFVSALDAAILNRLDYTKLDTVYELNLKSLIPKPVKGRKNQKTKNANVNTKYPPEFWDGLGCVKSNMK